MADERTIIDEAWLVLRAQAGDRVAMNQLLLGIAPPLTRFIGRITGDFCDDVCQDVLLTIARKLGWLDQPRAFRPWAYRIAARAALKYSAREKRVWPFESTGEMVEYLAALMLLNFAGLLSIVALAAVALATFISRHTLRVLRSVELLRIDRQT
jgi:DNA-directed RNA polymerase specialized sigma24 family protein